MYNTLDLGPATCFSGSYCSGDSDDYFLVYVGPLSTLNLRLKFTNSAADLHIRIINRNGREISFNQAYFTIERTASYYNSRRRGKYFTVVISRRSGGNSPDNYVLATGGASCANPVPIVPGLTTTTTTTSTTTPASTTTTTTSAAMKTEEEAVGPVRGVIRVGCTSFTQLSIANTTSIVFGSETATSFPTRMTERLYTRLVILAGLVEEDATGAFPPGTKLKVLAAYVEPPLDVSIPSTHYEGRAADITVTGSPTADQLRNLRSLADQAGMEYIMEEAALGTDPAHVHVSVIPDSCNSPLDLIFLLDGSGSIEMTQYGGAVGNFADKMLSFVEDVVNFFSISADETRIAVATFASDVQINFNLNKYGAPWCQLPSLRRLMASNQA